MSERVLSAQVIAFPSEADVSEILAGLDPTPVTGLTVLTSTFDANGWERTERILQDCRFRINAIAAVSFLAVADRASWPPQQQRLRDVIDLASRLGAERVYGTTGPLGELSFEAGVDALAEGLAPVLSHAEARGVELSIESTSAAVPAVSFATSLARQIDICDRVGLGIVVDIKNCWTEPDLDSLLRAVAGRTSMVQVSDFAVGMSERGQRAVPGDGDIPLGAVIATLMSAGFDGSWDLEVFGDRITAEGPVAAIVRGWRALEALLDHAEAGLRVP